MKCLHCEAEFSHSVILVHQEWCGEQKLASEPKEIKPLEKMTIPELLEVAAINEIDLGGAKLKPEIIAVMVKVGAKDDLGAIS